MSKQFRFFVPIVAFALAACTLLPSPAFAAAKTSAGVVTALQQKYQITETSTDSEQITKDGTTMVMKTAGIYSFPSSTYMKPDNHVIEGKIKSPSFIVKATWEKMGAHVLQSGDKVYITKMDSKSEGADTLRFTVLSVDSHDSASGQRKFVANVSFAFKKGYLDETPPEQVEGVIESVLAPDTGEDKSADKASEATTAAAKPAPAAAPAPPLPPPPAPAAPAPTITVGETSTDVLQAMGMPLQMIDLGKKKTYVYKNMKIIFMNDKVSDVQ